MEDSRDGYRKFLEIQVEGFQDRLYALERDPDQVDSLKSILRICQRLRHAQGPEEPEPVKLLRNAIEKVTLHLGRANLAVSREFLDFYVDSFDLLEEAVRRWPGGPTFDRARYADRVRALLETTAPRRGVSDRLGAADAPAALGVGEPALGEFGARRRRGGIMAEEPVGSEVAEEIELTGPEAPLGAESETGAATETSPAVARADDVPTWAESPAERRLEPRLELVTAEDLTAEERDAYVQADLRDLLSEPWLGPAGGRGAPRSATEGRGGGLAASFSTFESIRAPAAEGLGSGAASTEDVSAEGQAALARLRDVLDAFSLSLNDLERASDRLLGDDPGALGREAVSALVERLEIERDKLLSVFDRTIDSFRAGAL